MVHDISIKEFERVYDMLGVKFDAYTGESFYNDKMAAVVDELKEKGLLEESEGAMIVNLEDKNMPPCLIIRKDGGTLYANPVTSQLPCTARKHITSINVST